MLAAFQHVAGAGSLTAADLHATLDSSAHPDVLAGRRGAADVAAEFRDVFGPTGAAVVTPADFVEFYSNVSAAVDSDDVFELAVGPCPALSCPAPPLPSHSLRCPVLSCPVLSYPILSCPA